MTINRLRKVLDRLIAQGHGHKTIAVNRETFEHDLNEVQIMPVECIRVESVPIVDGDGGIQINKDGTEHCETWAVLHGWGMEPDHREALK